jgi:hypothetical protein
VVRWRGTKQRRLVNRPFSTKGVSPTGPADVHLGSSRNSLSLLVYGATEGEGPATAPLRGGARTISA